MGFTAVAPLVPLLYKPHQQQNPKREPEPGTQELEARIPSPLPPGVKAAFTGATAVAPLIRLFHQPQPPQAKREPEPETQELEARIHPLVLPGISAAAALAPLIPGLIPKPKREVSDGLYSVHTRNELEARLHPAALPGITTGLTALSAITPLIPNFFNKDKPKRDKILFSREPWDEFRL